MSGTNTDTSQDVDRDQALRAALARDVDAAFEGLVLAYQHRLYAFARSLAACPPDAEEVAQETFVRAYRALCAYPPARVGALALRPWLFQIAVNVVRNHNRTQRRRVTVVSPARGQPWDADGGSEVTGPLEPADDARERPDARAEQSEQRRELARLVATLPPRYRVPLVLRHVQGLSYDEIATITGKPLGTVKSDVHRGARLLRAALEGNESSLHRRGEPSGIS